MWSVAFWNSVTPVTVHRYLQGIKLNSLAFHKVINAEDFFEIDFAGAITDEETIHDLPYPEAAQRYEFQNTEADIADDKTIDSKPSQPRIPPE